MTWRLKALVQFVLAHMPFGEQLNHLAQLLNGSFSSPAQLSELLIQADYVRRLNQRCNLHGATIVEIGPGWQATGTITLSLFNPRRIYAIDHKPHLRYGLMQQLIKVARNNLDALGESSGLSRESLLERLDTLANATDLRALLVSMQVIYMAPGDAAATELPAHSVDVVYSYGVLEHISEAALNAIMVESVRILRPTGRACHNIGLHDHFHSAGLGNGVNFLRYPEWLWAFFCHNSIHYHNRLRLPHYLNMFRQHGLNIAWAEKELLSLNLEALKALRVDKRFSGLSQEELATSHLYVDLRP